MLEAKKSLGQNFLHDEKVLQEIIRLANIEEGDLILEIGPGQGALTEKLLASPLKKLLALELDDRLIPLLREKFSAEIESGRFELIHTDALQYIPPSESYKLIANVPYYISSPILNHYLRESFIEGRSPQKMVLMLQKEVVEKICLVKCKHSVLSLQVQLFGEVRYALTVPATCFDPIPKVDSAILEFNLAKEPISPAILDKNTLKKLFSFWYQAFAQKRKKLANNLQAYYGCKAPAVKEILTHKNISPDLRAEDLSLKEWMHLFLT